LAIAIVAFALRLPAIHDRFYSNDEATYSAIAAKLLSGGTMYVDAVDHKPPGIAWLYAGAFYLTGAYHLRGVRVLLAATVALTGIAVAELAASMSGQGVARIAGFLYVMLTATGFAPNTQAANTELFLNLPLTIAASAMLAHSRATRMTQTLTWTVIAGVATAAATLFRYQAALAGVAWLLSLWVPRRTSHPLTAAASLALGFGGAAAALIAGFWMRGHLDAFLFWGWRYNFQYISAVPWRRESVRFVLEALPIAAGWLPTLVMIAFARRKPMTLAWLWLAALCVAVCIGGRFYGNYFLMIAPPLAVLAGAGVAMLVSAERRRFLAWLAAGTVSLAIVSTLAVLVWDRLDPSPAVDDLQYRDAAEWIATHSTTGDRLLVWGDSAQIYVYSRRLMGTRFAFTNYQTGTIWGTAAFPGTPGPTTPSLAVPRAWDELLDDMRHTPPALIADAAAAGLHNFKGLEMENFPRLWDVVRANYRYETTRGGIRIYRLRRPTTE
jgi:hypothetical protein